MATHECHRPLQLVGSEQCFLVQACHVYRSEVRHHSILLRWRHKHASASSCSPGARCARGLCALTDRPALVQASGFTSTSLERTAMKIPTQIEPALWGVAGGALAIAIAGFGWGGWTTVSHVEATALVRSNDAVVVALAPVCVDKFRRAVDADANLAALRKTDAW